MLVYTPKFVSFIMIYYFTGVLTSLLKLFCLCDRYISQFRLPHLNARACYKRQKKK